MDFHFLGTANAFGHGGRRRSHYLWEGIETWLIDASYDAISGLRALNLDIRDIDKIFLSHLHPDHYMSLPQFALENYYALKRPDPVNVFGPIDTEETIIEATRLFFNEEVVEHLNDLFIFHEIGANKKIDLENGSLETLKADHTGNARMQLIEMEGTILGYTGDTGFSPDEFNRLLQADFTITEASSASHKIPHHTTLDDLLMHEIPKSKKVYVSHVGTSTIKEEHKIKPPLYPTYDGMKITI